MQRDIVSLPHNQTASTPITHTTQQKRIPIQERSCKVNDVIGINGYRVKRDLLKYRFVEGGFALHETPHFLICTREDNPTIIVHWFAPLAIDAELGHYFLEELKPLGLIEHPQRFGDVFCAIIGSLFPHDLDQAWHLFGSNTLQRYHTRIDQATSLPDCQSPVDVFTSLYRRICELCRGNTVLDGGCSFGLLPLVLAERLPSLTKVVGIDIATEPFGVARRIAEEQHLKQVQFLHADLLSEDVHTLGQFDTVTVLHVLEHFTEDEMYRVLENLLQLVSYRLIIAVPYEIGIPESSYGHQQLFTPDKLARVGCWCVDRWGGGSMVVEECAGGLLYVDRNAS